MNESIARLKALFTNVVESGSDSYFYENVHRYIDFIVKTPTLASIMEEAGKDYSIKHREIWGSNPPETDKEADEKEEETHRLEQFSLYAKNYAFLYSRIYSYIEEYKNHTEPDERPYPQAIVMLRGVKHVTTNLWSTKTLEQCSRWYTDKRKDYESRLQQFHSTFIDELAKLKTDTTTTSTENIPLSFNNKTGDFVFYNTKGNIPLGGQEFKVFSVLYNSPDRQADYSTLIRSYNPNLETPSKVYRDGLSLIIRNLKERFNILPTNEVSNPNIFVNIKKIGYRLVFEPINNNPE